MLSLLCLFFVYTLGKQNFQVVGLNGVTTAQALATCQTAGLCTTTTGCCNGHGVCKANLTVASCTCGVPQDCRPGLSQNAYPSYTGTTCNTVAIDSGCCKDGSDDHLYAASGVCNKRNTGDAETGAKGRLLQRLGNANYADGYGSFQDSLSQISSWQTDLLTGNVSYSRFNMMGLGFLQLALKDIVHLDYYPISEQNVTFNGTTYPKIRWQNNTGVSGSPKQFENVATAIVDLGPLYDYATKVGYGPYITATPAVTYWTNTHHMTNEFILALKYFGLYHNYVAANVEDYFCGAHSTNTSTHGNTCTISVAKQYDLARRSTILFFQNLVQQGPLFFALENPTDWFGTEDSFFFTFFLRDRDDTPWGYGPATTYDKVRTGMEFSDGITSASSQHHAISALDFFISARNPNINTTAFALFGSSAPCGYDPATITFPGGSSPAQILQDVVNYFHTKTQRWGSKIHSAYAAETALLLYRANELGLNSYKNVLSYLTDSVSATDLSTNVNVFYGIHKDTNSARKWRSTTPFVAIAANIVAISDITLHDRTGYWAVDSNTLWGLYQFHPDSSLIAQPDYEFANCYKGGGSTCTTQAWRGAQMLTGQFPLDPNFDSSWYSNIPQYMSRGALNGKPADLVYPHDQDQNSKPAMGWPLLSEFVHPLFYHYDGANSMAFRFADQTTYFLPNVIMDAFPSYIAYSNNWDGFCFQQTFVQGNAQYPACSRARTTANGGECWNFPYPVY